MSEPRWLNEREMRAWFGYRRMGLLLDLRINRELMNESGLSEPDSDGLSNPSQPDGHPVAPAGPRPPPRPLPLPPPPARRRWPKRRLPHHVPRRQQRGLVDREECADDGRGSML